MDTGLKRAAEGELATDFSIGSLILYKRRMLKNSHLDNCEKGLRRGMMRREETEDLEQVRFEIEMYETGRWGLKGRI